MARRRTATIAMVGLLVAGMGVGVAGRVGEGEQAASRVDSKPPSGRSASGMATRVRDARDAWVVRDLYARLMRYDFAARELDRAVGADGAGKDSYLVVAIRNIRTMSGEGSGRPLEGGGPILTLDREARCVREDPCHVAYRVAWGEPTAPSAQDGPPPDGPVTRVTTYEATLTLGGQTRTYRAELRYHAGEGGREAIEIVDPVIPGLQMLVDERAPLMQASWETHVRSVRYAAVVQRIQRDARAGKAVAPGRVPIGFLPGDDVTPQDEQPLALMASGVPCGDVCTGQPEGTPCPDEGNPSCSVDRCAGGGCSHTEVTPVGAHNPDPYLKRTGFVGGPIP